MRTSHVLTVAGSAVALGLGPSLPAVAVDPPTTEKWTTNETAAGVAWIEQDHEDSSGRPGTVHLGALLFESAAGNTGVFSGALADWECEPGQVPTERGGECVLVAAYEASESDVDLEFDRRAGTARVTGTVTFYDRVDDLFTVPVDLHWTTEGKPVRTRSHTIDLSPSSKFVMRTRTLTWSTIHVEGTVGSLVLGDEAGELHDQRLGQTESRFFLLTRPAEELPTDGDGGGGASG